MLAACAHENTAVKIFHLLPAKYWLGWPQATAVQESEPGAQTILAAVQMLPRDLGETAGARLAAACRSNFAQFGALVLMLRPETVCERNQKLKSGFRIDHAQTLPSTGQAKMYLLLEPCSGFNVRLGVIAIFSFSYSLRLALYRACRTLGVIAIVRGRWPGLTPGYY